MSYGIQDKEFWESRLNTAQGRGVLHHSVFVADNITWSVIEREHIRIIKKEIPTNSKVLDIACGYGRMSLLFTPEHYTGVDFSPDFIKLAKQKNTNYNFIEGNLVNLPFPNNMFDWGFGVSIKDMIVRECEKSLWEDMEVELRRVCKNLLFLEYSDGNYKYVNIPYEVIHCEDRSNGS